jgi:hypothetical protein
MNPESRPVMNDRILQRICGEFLEMPGLHLTRRQAQRLWGLDEKTCGELLERLVEMKFLYRTALGAYTRLTDGVAETPWRRAVAAVK